MKRFLTVIGIIMLLAAVAFAIYHAMHGNGGNVPVESGTGNSSGTLPIVPRDQQSGSSSLPDYIGTTSEVLGNLPTGDTLAIGTSQGTVSLNNFYASDPPVNEAGDLILKQTPE